MPDKYFGKYSGIVKDNRDPDNLGQIKVSVPTLFPEDELMMARAALPYGYFFVPNVDDLVWVEFEGGDSGLPIWTALQYVPGRWPDEAKANPPEKRLVRTKAGHMISLVDAEGSEKIEITEGAHHHVVTLDTNGIEVKDGMNQHTIKLSASGIQIEAKAGLISINAGAGQVEVKGAAIMLSSSAALPILRQTDQGIGNLGAPVPLIGPGNLTVLA